MKVKKTMLSHNFSIKFPKLTVAYLQTRSTEFNLALNSVVNDSRKGTKVATGKTLERAIPDSAEDASPLERFEIYLLPRYNDLK